MSRPLTEFIYAQNLPWKNGIPGNSKINLKHKTLSNDQDFVGLGGPNGVINKSSFFWRPENIPHGIFGSYNGSLTLIEFMCGKHKGIAIKKEFTYRKILGYKE
mgnify:CR=1 FL=1